jgi:hypothetical protein
VDYRVDDGLTHGFRGQVPAVLSPNRSDLGAVPGMLLYESDGLLHAMHGNGPDLDAIEDAGLVAPRETSGLDPGVREVLLAGRRFLRFARTRSSSQGKSRPSVSL